MTVESGNDGRVRESTGRRHLPCWWKEAYRRFGFDVDGVVMLPDTPEVRAFLDDESGQSEE